VKLAEVIDELKLTVVFAGDLGQEASGGFASDLLSNVMARASAGQVWITLQGHQNIVAVAVLIELAAVIIAGGVQPDAETRDKAAAEGVTILTTTLPVFEIAGRLYQLGLRGGDDL
jgi:predicted transcriptional regulator